MLDIQRWSKKIESVFIPMRLTKDNESL